MAKTWLRITAAVRKCQNLYKTSGLPQRPSRARMWWARRCRPRQRLLLRRRVLLSWRRAHTSYSATNYRREHACTHGPGRSFADRRGTTLRLKHRLQLRDGASKKMTRTCHQDDARTATGHLREDSSYCRRVGAVVLPNHPQRIAACEAVLEEAARSRTLNPPHWRRAARSGLSLRESPSPKVGPGGDLSCVVCEPRPGPSCGNNDATDSRRLIRRGGDSCRLSRARWARATLVGTGGGRTGDR